MWAVVQLAQPRPADNRLDALPGPAGPMGYGQAHADTKLLAKGNPIQVDPGQSQLALLDVASYRRVRLSAGNWEGSPGPVLIAISQIDQPNTPNANAIALVDSFTLAPGESASKVYEVLGDVVAFLANPEPSQSGIQLFFTIYGQKE